MPRKIIFIHGSPRPNGNTRVVAQKAIEAARKAGGAVTEVEAAALRYDTPGCSGCLLCQQSEEYRCQLADEVTEVVAGLPRFDTIVIATPVYWFSYPAQLKVIIDRMFSLVKFAPSGVASPLAGKTFGLLATAGGPEEGNLELLERQWMTPARILSCRYVSCLIPFAPYTPGALIGDTEALAKATAFGTSLAAK